MVDQVIFIWMEVQRIWFYLESIFIGLEDIRNQLFEDFKRFDGIDIDFKVLLCKRQQLQEFLFSILYIVMSNVYFYYYFFLNILGIGDRD